MEKACAEVSVRAIFNCLFGCCFFKSVIVVTKNTAKHFLNVSANKMFLEQLFQAQADSFF